MERLMNCHLPSAVNVEMRERILSSLITARTNAWSSGLFSTAMASGQGLSFGPFPVSMNSMETPKNEDIRNNCSTPGGECLTRWVERVLYLTPVCSQKLVSVECFSLKRASNLFQKLLISSSVMLKLSASIPSNVNKFQILCLHLPQKEVKRSK